MRPWHDKLATATLIGLVLCLLWGLAKCALCPGFPRLTEQ